LKESPIGSRIGRRRGLDERKPRLSNSSLFFIGLVIGLLGALLYAWVISPVVYTGASPARLTDQNKSEYILLISQNYVAGASLEETRERLAALGEDDIGSIVVNELENYLRQGEGAEKLRSLAVLARRLGVKNPAIDIFVPPLLGSATPTIASNISASTPENTRLPAITPPPSPTPTEQPSPTPVPVYRLITREQLCVPGQPAPMIEVVVVDPLFEPSPGIEVIVTWDEGEDHFFTGFHPDRGAGFGDFTMEPDISYQVMMADGSAIIENLRVTSCEDPRGQLAGGWQLTFQNTVVPLDRAGSSP